MFSIFCLLSAILSLLVSLIFLIVSEKKWSDLEKLSPFECGFSFMFKSQYVFSLQFFLITLIFLIFDIELVLIFPYILYSGASPLSKIVFLFVLTILILGFLWEWNLSMLDWVL